MFQIWIAKVWVIFSKLFLISGENEEDEESEEGSVISEENALVAKYQELSRASSVAVDRALARRYEIQREFNIGLVSAELHPDYRALMEFARRLNQEAQLLTPSIIRANLESFGIIDPKVTGVLHLSDNESIPGGGHRFRDGREVGRVEMSLSDICGLRYSGLAGKLGVEPQTVSLRVYLEEDGRRIGHIDSDGDFDYEAAPDLRTALGWKIATDGGRTALIKDFDLDQATKSILDTVRSRGTSKDAFYRSFFEVVKEVFVYKHTSRFGDGYCGAVTVLWHAATRELGEEHPGYPFAY